MRHATRTAGSVRGDLPPPQNHCRVANCVTARHPTFRPSGSAGIAQAPRRQPPIAYEGEARAASALAVTCPFSAFRPESPSGTQPTITQCSPVLDSVCICPEQRVTRRRERRSFAPGWWRDGRAVCLGWTRPCKRTAPTAAVVRQTITTGSAPEKYRRSGNRHMADKRRCSSINCYISCA